MADDPFDRAQSFLHNGHIDLAAVFFAAAMHSPTAAESKKNAARANAARLGERVAQDMWGATASEFLGDHRHQYVCEAVASACADGKRVLMLGSAFGTYALAAARAGAKEVICIESNSLCEYVASVVVQAYELECVSIRTVRDNATVTNDKFDVLVATELLWGSGMTSDSINQVLAKLPLLEASACVIPETVSLWAQAMESETLHSLNWLDCTKFQDETGFDYTFYNSLAKRSRLAWHLSAAQSFRALSSPVEWLHVSFINVLRSCHNTIDGEVLPLKGDAELTTSDGGYLDSIVTWTSMQLSSGLEPLTWGPGRYGGTEWQYCHYLQNCHQLVSADERLTAPFELSQSGVWLSGHKTHGDAMELSPYHTSMLTSHSQRTLAYQRGIESAVQSLRQIGPRDTISTVHALDIGAGTGLLSFFAAKAGAHVVAVERSKTTVEMAEKLLKCNQETFSGGKVHIVHAASRELSVEKDHLPRPSLIVSEIFGTDPLSETILPTLKHATEVLISDGAPIAMLPCRCRLWGTLALVPKMWEPHTEDAAGCGVEYGEFLAPFESSTILVDLRKEFDDIGMLAEPVVLATHSLVPPISVSGSCTTSITLFPKPAPLHEVLSLPKTSRLDAAKTEFLEGVFCLLLWFDADCTTEPCDDPSTRISTSPEFEFGASWSQWARILREEDLGEGVEDCLTCGSGTIRITTAWQVDQTSFSIELDHRARTS